MGIKCTVSVLVYIYNAISLYQKTAKPPITPTDTRSITDKFSDIIYVQVQLRKLIREITDDKNTTDIMDDLVKDPPLMIFALQNFPEIKAYSSKRYAVGIIYQDFMKYLRRMFARQRQPPPAQPFPFPAPSAPHMEDINFERPVPVEPIRRNPLSSFRNPLTTPVRVEPSRRNPLAYSPRMPVDAPFTPVRTRSAPNVVTAINTFELENPMRTRVTRQEDHKTK